MKFKRIYSIVLAGAIALGAALSSGVSAYAASEDWFKIDVDSEGNSQPSTKFVPYNPPYVVYYEVSCGYTLHSDYKYLFRVPYDERGYDSDDINDGYGYVDMIYYPEQNRLTAFPYATQFSKNWLLNDTNIVPSGVELIIRVDAADPDEVTQVLTTSYILVYDKNNNLVDSFPVLDLTADHTTPVTPVETVPTPVTEIPATETVTAATDPAGSDTIVAVAKEIVKGKWGVGAERRIRLERAGYNYKEVQKKVSELMK